MTTIEVGGIDALNAPSPIQLTTWHGSWATLTGLTAWAASPAGSTTNFRCTTTSSLMATNTLAGTVLAAWVALDPGHRHYSVA